MAHFFDRSSCGSPDPPLPGKSLITPPPSKGSASKVKSYLADGSAFPSLTNAISFGSPSGALPTHSSALPALPPFDYSTRPHLPSDPFSHIMSSPTSDAYHDPAHYPSSDSESTTYSSSFRSPPQSFRRISHSGRPSDLDLILNPVAEEPLSSSFQDYSFFDSRPSSRDLTPLPEETDPDTSMELATSPYTPTLPHRGPFRAEFAFSERDYPPTASGPSAFGPSSLPPPPNFFTRYGQVERPLKTARTAASDSEMGSAEPNHPPFSPPLSGRSMSSSGHPFGPGGNVAPTSTSEDPKNPSPCKWSTCAAVFRSMDELTRHLYKLHVSGRNQGFHCKWASCQVEKGDTDQLIQHVCSDHLGQPNLRHVCGWLSCRQEFDTFDDLTAHLSNDHIGSGRSQYYCAWEECNRAGKPFSQRQRAMRHIQTHTGDKPYQCIICGKRFSESHIMGQHMRIHTGEKPYKCPSQECGRTFTVSSALTIHIRTHTGEKPFKCKYDGCAKRFAESSNLTKHMRVHTGERPFRCPVETCAKKFSRPDQVARHQKTHSS